MEFIHACKGGDVDHVEYLISKGQDPTFKYNKGLQVAIKHGNYKVIRYLIKQKEVINHWTFTDCLLSENINNLKIYKIFINAFGISLFDNSGIDSFIEDTENKSVKKYLTNIKNGALDFINGCKTGDLELVKSLVESGLNPTFDDNEGILLAIENSNYDVIRYLISQEKVTRHYLYTDYLLTTDNFNDVEIYKILIEEGCLEFTCFDIEHFMEETTSKEVLDYLIELNGGKPSTLSK